MSNSWSADSSSRGSQSPSPGNNEAEDSLDPVLFAHRCASQYELGEKNRADVADIAQYIRELPPALIMVSLINLTTELKTHETLAGIQQAVEKLTTKVESVIDGLETNPVLSELQKGVIMQYTKGAVVDPLRTSFNNDSIVADVYASLKKSSDRTSLKAHFEAEHASMVHAVKKEIRSSASYAKTTLRNLVMKTNCEGVTKATETIYKTLGSGSKRSAENVQETARVVILRRFVRERPQLFVAPTAKEGDRKVKKKRRRMGDNLPLDQFGLADPPIPDPYTMDPTTTSGSDELTQMTSWATAFTEWIGLKVNGTTNDDGTAGVEGWGAAFKNDKWHSFYGECIDQELLRFPADSIPAIPRRAPIAASLSSPNVLTLGSPSLGMPNAPNGAINSPAPQNRNSSFFTGIGVGGSSAPRFSTPSQNPTNGGLRQQTMTPATFGFPRLRSMTPVQLGSHSDEPPLTRAGPLFPGRNVPSSTGSVGGESFVFRLFELTLTVLSGARSVSGPQNGSGYMPEGEGRRSVSEGFASRNAKDMDGGSPEGRADNEASQHWSPGDSDSSFNDAPIY